MNRKLRKSDNIPAELIHQDGRYKGQLNQPLLHVDSPDLKAGDPHPLSSEVLYVQTKRSTGRQTWTTKARAEWRKMSNAKRTLSSYHKNKKASK